MDNGPVSSWEIWRNFYNWNQCTNVWLDVNLCLILTLPLCALTVVQVRQLQLRTTSPCSAWAQNQTFRRRSSVNWQSQKNLRLSTRESDVNLLPRCSACEQAHLWEFGENFWRRSPVGGGGTWVNFCWVCAGGLSESLPHYSLFCGQL